MHEKGMPVINVAKNLAEKIWVWECMETALMFIFSDVESAQVDLCLLNQFVGFFFHKVIMKWHPFIAMKMDTFSHWIQRTE